MLDVNAKGMKPLTKGMIEFVIDCLKREPTNEPANHKALRFTLA